jgi:chloramphenicol-sensitive protein RarD
MYYSNMLKRKIASFHSRAGRAGVIYAIAAYSLWGILPIYWKAMKQIPAGEILAHRIFWSFLLLMAVIGFTKKWTEFKKAFSGFKSIVAIFLGSILISINWLIYIWAVNNNHIVEASLGYYINPLFTILLGIVVLRERPDVWQIVAIALAGVGVGFLTLQYGEFPWVALSLAISFGLYGLVKKLSKLSSINGLAAETLLVAPMAFGYLCFRVTDDTSVYPALPVLVIVLVLLSGLATSIPLLLFAQGAKRVPLSTMGFVQYLSPSISLVLGIFIYDEPFTHVEKVSFTLIWIALAIYSFSRKEILKKIIQFSGLKIGRTEIKPD